MDAARITQKRCFGSVRNSQPKVYKDVHFWLRQRSRCAVYLQKYEEVLRYVYTETNRNKMLSFAAQS